MRLLLKIASEGFVPFNKINKHTIQGMLYSHLKGTKYENLHLKKGFKFFTFSDLFPANDFYPHKEKTLIISSPDRGLIETWYNSFKDEKYLYLSDEAFEKISVRKISLSHHYKFETGSPIVLYEKNRDNLYFSFKRGKDLKFFLDRLKDNAIKKYNAFYNDEFTFEEPLFDRLIFRKEVMIRLKKETSDFSVIGSMWKLLEKVDVDKENRKFYMFLMDCGLGEKNSLGFGFLNPKKTG